MADPVASVLGTILGSLGGNPSPGPAPPPVLPPPPGGNVSGAYGPSSSSTTGSPASSSGGGGSSSGGGGGGSPAPQTGLAAVYSAIANLPKQIAQSILADATGRASATSVWNPSSPSSVTPGGFASALLNKLGAPRTTANLQGLLSWINTEGGNWHNQAQFNPLNTKQGAPGATSPAGFASPGIKAYPNWNTGLDATVATLKNGNYPGILSALKAGNDPQAIAHAVAASPWGTGSFGISVSPQQAAAAASAGPSTAGASNVAPSVVATGGSPYLTPQGLRRWAQAVAALGTSNKAIPAKALTTPSGYVNPIPGYTLGRTDMGVDANAPVGTPIKAIGDSKLVSVHPFYQGQPLYEFQFQNGPRSGQYWYVAEQIASNMKPGDTVKAGQPVGTYAPSGTGIEIGFGGDAAGQTLAQTTTGYHEGQVTPAGVAFGRFLGDLKNGGSVPAPAPGPSLAQLANPALFNSSATPSLPPTPSLGTAASGTPGLPAPNTGAPSGASGAPGASSGPAAVQQQQAQLAQLAQLQAQQNASAALQGYFAGNPGNLWNTMPAGLGSGQSFGGGTDAGLMSLLSMGSTGTNMLGLAQSSLQGLAGVPLADWRTLLAGQAPTLP